MRQLGLSSTGYACALLGAVALACKTAPETAPPGASAPVATATSVPTVDAQPAPAPSAAAPARAPHTYPDTTTQIEATTGERFLVALPANITLPMKWRLDGVDTSVLAPGGENYVEQAPADCPGCTGYGGTRLFAFTAKGAGKTKLHFAWRPLTDASGPAQKEVTIDVSVR